MRIRKLIKLIESDGWVFDRQKGDHRQYVHPDKPNLVTISGHLDDDVNPKTLNRVLKQAGLKKRR
jgi:predicted RNA binding protein YcfA (HicA-like mRNA interferase family)